MRNPALRLLPAMLALALATCLPQTSHALFGREKVRLLKEADNLYTEAIAAGQEGRVLDELTGLTEARARYTRLFSQYPNYQAEHIQQRVAKCSLRIATIGSKIRSGEVSVPSPDAITEGVGKGFVTPSDVPAIGGNSIGMPMPPLLPLAEVEGKTKAEEVKPKTEKIRPVPPPQPVEPRLEVAPPPPAAADPGLESNPLTPSSILADADDATRVRLVQAITEKDGPAQAMVLLEDLVEAEDDKASETTRALFVKTLIACRNYKRAAVELDALRERHPNSPATLSLAAAVAAQTGDLTEAIYQLDKLVARFPAYSDAYVNLAYAYYMLDPVKNKEMAAVYYRSAISYGARRDPKLEEILDLDIVL